MDLNSITYKANAQINFRFSISSLSSHSIFDCESSVDIIWKNLVFFLPTIFVKISYCYYIRSNESVLNFVQFNLFVERKMWRINSKWKFFTIFVTLIASEFASGTDGKKFVSWISQLNLILNVSFRSDV